MRSLLPSSFAYVPVSPDAEVGVCLASPAHASFVLVASAQDGGGPVAHLELGAYVGDVVAHRLEADAQPLGISAGKSKAKSRAMTVISGNEAVVACVAASDCCVVDAGWTATQALNDSAINATNNTIQ